MHSIVLIDIIPHLKEHRRETVYTLSLYTDTGDVYKRQILFLSQNCFIPGSSFFTSIDAIMSISEISIRCV